MAQERLLEVAGGGQGPQRYYPDDLAKSHNTSEAPTWAAWESGSQSQVADDVGSLQAVSEPESDQEPVKRGEDTRLELRCPEWAILGECELGHYHAKSVYCNREWCQGECGGEGGPAHQRRKAAWLPKARQIADMGRFVFTIPPEVRSRYKTKEALGKLGTAAKRMMQRFGYGRGLRRWHLFGEDHRGHGIQGSGFPLFHPHLEVLVDERWLDPEKLEAIKRSWANILHVPVDRVNFFYEYIPADQVRKKLHRVSYALRPTFTDWRWYPALAHELVGFHNAQPWGKWDGNVVWDVPEYGTGPGPELQALVEGRCPVDGTKIKWGGLMPAKKLLEPDWKSVEGGYWLFNGLVWDAPG